MTQGQTPELFRIEKNGRQGVMIDNHQITTPLLQRYDRVVDVGGNDPRIELLIVLLKLLQPFRQECHRQAVAGSDLDGSPWHPLYLAKA
ncbi:hypothetical protein D3C80_935680 [compost metagenome]